MNGNLCGLAKRIVARTRYFFQLFSKEFERSGRCGVVADIRRESFMRLLLLRSLRYNKTPTGPFHDPDQLTSHATGISLDIIRQCVNPTLKATCASECSLQTKVRDSVNVSSSAFGLLIEQQQLTHIERHQACCYAAWIARRQSNRTYCAVLLCFTLFSPHCHLSCVLVLMTSLGHSTVFGFPAQCNETFYSSDMRGGGGGNSYRTCVGGMEGWNTACSSAGHQKRWPLLRSDTG